jgi:hypothetical protein
VEKVGCVSKGRQIQRRYEWCLSDCWDDHASSRDADLDRSRIANLRRGFTGLSAIVQLKSEQDPFGGQSLYFEAGEEI